MNRNIEIQQIETMAAMAAAGNTKIQKNATVRDFAMSTKTICCGKIHA